MNLRNARRRVACRRTGRNGESETACSKDCSNNRPPRVPSLPRSSAQSMPACRVRRRQPDRSGPNLGRPERPPPAEQETVGILAARFLHAHGGPRMPRRLSVESSSGPKPAGSPGPGEPSPCGAGRAINPRPKPSRSHKRPPNYRRPPPHRPRRRLQSRQAELQGSGKE